jgi:hypothetical protein
MAGRVAVTQVAASRRRVRTCAGRDYEKFRATRNFGYLQKAVGSAELSTNATREQTKYHQR